jgi:hypothetical protein
MRIDLIRANYPVLTFNPGLVLQGYPGAEKYLLRIAWGQVYYLQVWSRFCR